MNARTKKLLAFHAFVFTIIAAYLLLLGLTNIQCPFKWLFHIPCPTCGTVRALISLARLDIHAYFSYNPMALPLLAALWLGIHQHTPMLKAKPWVIPLVIAIAVLTAALYVIRLLG